MERANVKTWVITVDGREWEAHPATPAYDGTTGLFHMPTAYTLPKGKFSFQLFRDNLDRDPKDEDISIHGVSLGFGLTDRFEIYGNFGLQNRIDADALFQPGRVNDYPFVSTPWETGRGDMKLGVKFKFLDDYQHGDPIALAIRGFVKIPTADKDLGLGTGKTSWGGDLVASKGLGHVLDIHGSIGYQVNGDPDDPVPVDLANAFKWAVGLNVPACSWVQLQAELMGTQVHRRRRRHDPAHGDGHEQHLRPQQQPRTQHLRDRSPDQPARPRDRPGHLDQGLLHPSRHLLEPQLRRPRAELQQQELDGPSHLHRLPPRLGLPRDRGAAAAAAAAAGQPSADGELRDRADHDPAG